MDIGANLSIVLCTLFICIAVAVRGYFKYKD